MGVFYFCFVAVALHPSIICCPSLKTCFA